MKDEKAQKAAKDLARMMNYREHARKLAIPVLNGFTPSENQNPQVIMVATADGFVEQLVSDGPLSKNETFEDRIELVKKTTKDFMKANGMEDSDKSFMFLKDYKNDHFEFKAYVQDIILNVDNEKKAIRQFNLYFVEPEFNDFYQLTLGAGPFDMPTEMLKIGEVDLENDQVTKILNTMATTIMDNLKYKNKK